MLIVRYSSLPDGKLFEDHLRPFSVLFLVWVTVFFIAGLYEKHTLFFKKRLFSTLLNVQVANSLLAVLFFYFIPYFGITPKTNLFLYLVISFLLLLMWRLVGPGMFGFRKKQPAVLVGSGEELHELYNEVNNNDRYSLHFVSIVDLAERGASKKFDLEKDVLAHLRARGDSILVIDLKDDRLTNILPELYNLVFARVHFVDIHKVYEDIFDRIPLSLIKHSWFLENISLAPKTGYDVFKRVVDIGISFVLGLISLLFYPFVWLAIKIEDGGPLFIAQKRVGQNDQIINLYKFRSMAFDDAGDQSQVGKNYVTRVGKFIRKTRIDEFPQFWNVLRGDLSFVGPRSELPLLVTEYEKEVPYYKVRHLVKPGLSGWAQIYHKDPPKATPNVDKTRAKLSYDLYYIKNRSVWLDLSVTLKTLKVFFLRSGV
jgi:exopolysaccharide biosynthesis polyprenyl glycosylphosphotransferase